MIDASGRVKLKRTWREQHKFVVDRSCCFNCKLYEGTDVMIGFCWNMSMECDIPLIESQVYATYVCDNFVSKEA